MSDNLPKELVELEKDLFGLLLMSPKQTSAAFNESVAIKAYQAVKIMKKMAEALEIYAEKEKPKHYKSEAFEALKKFKEWDHV